jgi:glyoxylase-like metal-dependent hydrolase (beta-lactamase superfamily II)
MKLLHSLIPLFLGLVAPAVAARAADATVSADVYRFKIGKLDAFALKDGDITVPNDGKTVGIGQPPATVSALLTAAGLSTETVQFSIQPLLVLTEGRIVLFDTGAGRASFAVAGRLFASLHSAGVDPAAVTDIFISHGHPDHVGGLLDANGAPAFPNATIHLAAAEWAAMKKAPDQALLVSAITPKVATFKPGEKIAPGITAIDIAGHTPGHSGAEIVSHGERLLYIGDTVHHSIISVQRPEWTIGFDVNPAASKVSRRAILQKAADENLRIFAVHFPFPGLGHIRKQGADFVWIPER